MVVNVKREWHKFWFIAYNSILENTVEVKSFEKYIKKSKYHGDKLLQLLQ